MNPGELLRIVGGEIGNARRRTCDRGNGAVVWTGLLGKGDVVWEALLGLCVRLRRVAGMDAVHSCIQAAFPVEYEADFIAGQLATTEGKILRGEFVPGWRDLVTLVPQLKKYEADLISALREANGGNLA